MVKWDVMIYNTIICWQQNQSTLHNNNIILREDNAVMHIHELSSNYTNFSGKWKRIFKDNRYNKPSFNEMKGTISLVRGVYRMET